MLVFGRLHTVLLHNDGCDVASGLNGVQAQHIRCPAEFGDNVRAICLLVLNVLLSFLLKPGAAKAKNRLCHAMET